MSGLKAIVQIDERAMTLTAQAGLQLVEASRTIKPLEVVAARVAAPAAEVASVVVADRQTKMAVRALAMTELSNL
jgi:hypothetical protein